MCGDTFIDVTLLVGCARCNADGHENLRFEKLVYPIADPEGDYTHWTPCPTNGQPILFRRTKAPA